MGEELRTVGPPIAVTVWFCRECNETLQGDASKAAHVIECYGEPERLSYVRADDAMVHQISDLMLEARLNDLTRSWCDTYARRQVGSWRGDS